MQPHGRFLSVQSLALMVTPVVSRVWAAMPTRIYPSIPCQLPRPADLTRSAVLKREAGEVKDTGYSCGAFCGLFLKFS